MTEAETDLRQLIALARAAVVAVYDGSDFAGRSRTHLACYQTIGEKCRDTAYHAEFKAACDLLLPHP